MVAVADASLAAGTGLLLGGAMIAAGADFDVGRAGVRVAASALLILAATRVAFAPVALPLPRRMWPWLAFGGLLVLSLVDLPTAIVERVSPRSAEVYDVALARAGDAALSWSLPGEQVDSAHPLTLSRWTSLQTISLGASYVIVFVLCACWPWRDGTVVRLLAFLGGMSVLQAAYAFFQQGLDAPRLLWFACLEHTTCTGTYLNRNHFAGFLEMTLPLLLAAAGWCLQRAGRRAFDPRSTSLREALVGAGEWLSDPFRGQALALCALAALVVVGLALSSSRSAFFFTLAVVVAMAPLRPVRRIASGSRALLAPIVVVAATAIVWLSFPQVQERMSFHDPTRLKLWADGADVIRSFPMTGVGLGNFSSTYPLFRSRTLSLWGFPIDHAHNDFIEWAAEVGIPAAIVSLALLFGLTMRCLLALRAREVHGSRAWALWGCTAGTATLLLHSLTDFNLHVPANALVFAALLGVMARLVRVGAGSPWRCTRVAGVALMIVGSLWLTSNLDAIRAAAAYASVHPDLPLRSLVEAPAQSAPEPALNRLRAAVDAAPRSPRYQAGLGRALLRDAEAGDSTGARVASRRALISSLQSAPLQPVALLDLASIAVLEGHAEVAQHLVARAITLSPRDPEVRLQAASWLIARLSQDPPDREWSRRQVEDSLALAAAASRLREEHARLTRAYQALGGTP